ncbi:hypothetical protein [Shimazuella alba]|uniref:Uncharacterized protein n=1 Tax=Shimazuella alba TaxID=2690964 RepID=A0A6I4VXV8_9BACL|nr:hypothetical protein [Shimazuella alba]MXQ55561.1 hypothetical protein [Shimazuella alba]
MTDTSKNDVTAQEIIEAVAMMTPFQLHHWCSRKRATAVVRKYNDILWDLKLEALGVCAANHTWLEQTKDPSGKPGPHKVRGQEMFELFLIFQEVFNSEQQNLSKEQMEYLQTWTNTLENLLKDSVHHLWSDTAGVIDIESVYGALLDTCTKAIQSITPESKRLWWDILEVLESIAGMACTNTNLAINLLRNCSRMLLKH